MRDCEVVAKALVRKYALGIIMPIIIIVSIS